MRNKVHYYFILNSKSDDKKMLFASYKQPAWVARREGRAGRTWAGKAVGGWVCLHGTTRISSHHRSLLSGVTKRHLPIVYIIINSTSMVGIHQAATQQDLIARCITAAPHGESRGSLFVEPRTKGVNSRHLPKVTNANLYRAGPPIKRRDLGISNSTTACIKDTNFVFLSWWSNATEWD